MNDYLKYAAGTGLFLLWAALVFALKLDPSDLIATIKIALFAILGFVGVTKLQAASPGAASTATPLVKSSALPMVPLSEGPK